MSLTPISGSLISGGSLVSGGSLLPENKSLVTKKSSVLDEEKTGSLVKGGSLSLQGVGAIHRTGFDANVIGGISIGIGLVALGGIAILVSGGTASPVVLSLAIGVGCEGVVATAEGIRGGIESDFNWSDFAVNRAVGLGITCVAGGGVYINSLRNASKQAADIATTVAKNAARWRATRRGAIVSQYIPFLTFTASLEVMKSSFRSKIVSLPHQDQNASLRKLHLVEIMRFFYESKKIVESILTELREQDPENEEAVLTYLDSQLNGAINRHLAIQNEIYLFLNGLKDFTINDLERLLKDSKFIQAQLNLLLEGGQ